MRKSDKILLISLGIGVLISVLFFLFPKSPGKTVTVKEKGKVIYTLPLAKNQTVELSGNRIVIKDGTAFVESATCKNQICVRHAPISNVGESILCLPNQVSVTIGGGE